MAEALIVSAGGGTSSDECTALLADVIKGKTAVTNNSNDEPGIGTLELTGNAAISDVYTGKTFYNNSFTKQTGSIPVANISGLKAVLTAVQQVTVSYTRPSSGKWSGIIIAYRTDRYPYNSSGESGTSYVDNSSGSRNLTGLTNGKTYYIRCWSYLTTSAGRLVNSSYSSVSVAVANNTGIETKTSGSGTWNCPVGITKVDVFCVGGGAGGQGGKKTSGGGGGGGGGYCRQYLNISVTPGTNYSWAVGGSGSGGAKAGGKGGTGGRTWFNSSGTYYGEGGYPGEWVDGGSASTKGFRGGDGGSGGGAGRAQYAGAGVGGSNGANGGAAGSGIRGGNGGNSGTGTHQFFVSTAAYYSGGGGGGGLGSQSGKDGGAATGGSGGKGGSSGSSNGTNGSAYGCGGGGGYGPPSSGGTVGAGGAGSGGILVIRKKIA